MYLINNFCMPTDKLLNVEIQLEIKRERGILNQFLTFFLL